MSQHTEDAPLNTTAERQAIVESQGATPSKEWVIVTRGLTREYDMGGEVACSLKWLSFMSARSSTTSRT